MPRHFQFSLTGLLWWTAIGLWVVVLILSEDAQSAYVQWFVVSAFVVTPLGYLLLLPAWWFVLKVGQSLLGHLPTDELKDAVPIRFDVPPDNDDD